jgi:hypothetical protein
LIQLRKDMKRKLNELNILEGKAQIKGFDLEAMSKKEMDAIKKSLSFS